MNAAPNPKLYEAVLVPALQRIQHEFGYLKREELQKYSAKSGIPEYRLQAVASFFPHFQLTPPKKCTVKICRDMACHLAGSAETLRDLQAAVSPDVAVEGVSCVGRCDRAAAAGITVQGLEHDLYYHRRTTAELKQIIIACLTGVPPPPDHDADLAYSPKNWVIDAYQGATPRYEAITKAVALRDGSLKASMEYLAATFGWGPDRLERFRQGAIRQLHVDFSVEPEVEKAVLAWQTEQDWAAPADVVVDKRSGRESKIHDWTKGPRMGGWSDVLINELNGGDLRGLGGAGIPAKQKWVDVRDAIRTARRRGKDDRAFIVVNGDESEPGTFKDRELLLRAPHTILEGVILAGLITEATQGFIYIRHEYGEQVDACRAEIKRAEELGFCGINAAVLGRTFKVEVFVSPGGYICGEQSALIEAMSDRRGEPRNMPPKLETNGLEDLPTLVSNVETYAWAPYIVIKGGKTYSELGENTWKGRRFFSMSGDVKRPGVYEVPMGMTLRELIMGEQYCQGMLNDRPLKAFAPSGPSGGFLPAKLRAPKQRPARPPKEGEKPKKDRNWEAWTAFAARRGIDPLVEEFDIMELELELNLFRGLSPTQALGAGVVVYAEGRDMVAEALNSLQFYRAESCGKCVPCRIGSQKLTSLVTHLLAGKIEAERWDKELVPLVIEVNDAISLASICGLGRSVPQPLSTVINYFGSDIDQHLIDRRNGAHA